MSNLVGDFIEKTKPELGALETSDPDLAIAVMQALAALAEYETVVPQRISDDQKSQIDNETAMLSLAAIDPVSKAITPLTLEQEQALANRGYNGTPESTTEDDDMDDIMNLIDAMAEDTQDIDLDSLDDDLEDLLGSI